jgi:hypothetical protein
MLALLSRRISYPLTTNGSVKTYTRTILEQRLVYRAMTMCEFRLGTKCFRLETTLIHVHNFGAIILSVQYQNTNFVTINLICLKTCHNRTVPRGTTSEKRFALFWAITKRIVIIPFRRFLGDRLSRSVGKDLQIYAA